MRSHVKSGITGCVGVLPAAWASPDAVFQEIAACARRLQLPPASLLAVAAWEFLARHRSRSTQAHARSRGSARRRTRLLKSVRPGQGAADG